MQEGYWITRTYQAGTVGEKTKFFIPGARPTGKISRKAKDAMKKQEHNEYSSQKALARLINNNFEAGDLLMGLDYSEEGMQKILGTAAKKGILTDGMDEAQKRDAIYMAAENALENCLRRARNRLKKQGIELKAIYCTSDMDGQTGEAVRVHHHLIVPAEQLEAFISAWEKSGWGHVDYTGLWEDQQDRTAIAEYWMRQVRRIPNIKKYRHTQNVVAPEPKDRIALSDAELRVPKGGTLLFRQEYKPGWPQYIRYTIPVKKKPGIQEGDADE